LDSNVVPARFGPREAHDRAFGRPDPLLPGPPLSRRSGERLAVASAGPALVGFRGFSEVRVRKVAPDLVRRSRSAGFGGFPVFPSVPRIADRRPRPRLSQPRAPLQGTVTEGSTPGVSRPAPARAGAPRLAPARAKVRLGPTPPSRLPSPTASSEPRIRSSRVCRTRHLPSSAFLTPSTVYAPRFFAGLFHPADAPGVPPSGPCSSPGIRASLEAACSLAVRRRSRRAVKRDGRWCGLQSFPLPGESVPRATEIFPRSLPS